MLLALSLSTHAQKVELCATPEKAQLQDLNSITKCTIEKDEKTNVKRISFEVSPRKHVIKKRNLATNAVTTGYQQTVSNIKKKTKLITDLALKDESTSSIVSFHDVDQIPLFEKCEDTPYLKQENCFRKQIFNHIQMNFQYPEKAHKAGIQGRVLVNFLIDKEGNTRITNLLSPYKGELLKAEVERIIGKLPKFIPGNHHGREVDVHYTQQITFKIPGVKRTNIRPKKINEIKIDKFYKFEELDVPPLFENCANENDNSSDCFLIGLQKYVQKNFTYPADAMSADIQGAVNINFVISKTGDIVNIITKGPENGTILEDAAEELIKNLPKFRPGLKNNAPVHTTYEFRINFNLN